MIPGCCPLSRSRATPLLRSQGAKRRSRSPTPARSTDRGGQGMPAPPSPPGLSLLRHRPSARPDPGGPGNSPGLLGLRFLSGQNNRGLLHRRRRSSSASTKSLTARHALFSWLHPQELVTPLRPFARTLLPQPLAKPSRVGPALSFQVDPLDQSSVYSKVLVPV